MSIGCSSSKYYFNQFIDYCLDHSYSCWMDNMKQYEEPRVLCQGWGIFPNKSVVSSWEERGIDNNDLFCPYTGGCYNPKIETQPILECSTNQQSNNHLEMVLETIGSCYVFARAYTAFLVMDCRFGQTVISHFILSLSQYQRFSIIFSSLNVLLRLINLVEKILELTQNNAEIVHLPAYKNTW